MKPPSVSRHSTDATEAPTTSEATSSWEHFEIPHSCFPKHISNMLEKGLRPTPKTRREFIRIVMDEVLKTHHKPTKQHLSIVADKLVQKYPESFEDKIGDIVMIGAGRDALTNKLVDRRDNLARNVHIQSLKRERTNIQDSNEVKNKKKKPKDSYGCVNWQPPVTVNDDVKESQELLKAVTSKEEKDWDKDSIEKAMAETFPMQRHCINAGYTISELQNEWPVLFTKYGLKCHFRLLMDFDCMEVLTKSFKTKASKILAFCKGNTEGNKGIETILSEMAKVQEKNEDNRAMCPGVLLLIMVLLKEDPDTLFVLKEVSRVLYC